MGLMWGIGCNHEWELVERGVEMTDGLYVRVRHDLEVSLEGFAFYEVFLQCPFCKKKKDYRFRLKLQAQKSPCEGAKK